MRKIKQNLGFTLIELIVVIAIIAILFSMGFMNYAYSQNLAKMRMNAKDVAQVLYNARNMAINGYSFSGSEGYKNNAIGVFFKAGNGVDESGKIITYSCRPNATETGALIGKDFRISDNFSNTGNCVEIKNLELHKNIFLNRIGDDPENGPENIFLIFSPVFGEVYRSYNVNTANTMSVTGVTEVSIDFNISFGKYDDTKTMQNKKLKYIIGTYIVDY